MTETDGIASDEEFAFGNRGVVRVDGGDIGGEGKNVADVGLGLVVEKDEVA